MLIGMLWFDSSSISLSAKIKKAADYYQKKYRRAPELCLVHPSMLTDQTVDESTRITVRPYRPVLPGHMWLGIEEKPMEWEKQAEAHQIQMERIIEKLAKENT